MKTLNAQIDILKALDKNKTIQRFEVGGKIVIIDEVHGWAFDPEVLLLDLRRIVDCPALLDPEQDGEPLAETDFYRRVGKVRCYLRPNGSRVYIDTALTKYFEEPLYFQTGGEKGLIIVKETNWATGELELAGLVAPVRLGGEE